MRGRFRPGHDTTDQESVAGDSKMDITLLVAFIAFFGMVLAWLAAPNSMRLPAMIETSAVGAD